MPGFLSVFGRSSASANMGGVMISQEIYMTLMDIPPIPYLDKIFVKLNLYSQDMSQDIIFDVRKNDNDFDFEVINLEQRITQQQLLFSIINIFFSITLDATIVICLFGLLSSSYSTIIERKKEIGIIRTLGLKGKEIVRLFTIESLIIMMSSGTVGVIVGWVTGLLLSMSMNMMSGLPNIPIFPLTDMIIIFSLSIIFTLIGIRLLLRKSRKKNIVEIYRETT
jgi:ABC-type antimicrobial peptide transport system permease subunit